MTDWTAPLYNVCEIWRSHWALALACFCAGTVDSIGGGGGLISVPALMAAGAPGPYLLGTNKSMSAVGSSVAVARYSRAGLLPRFSGARWALLIGLALMSGSAGAAVSQSALFLSHLRALVPVLLAAVMVFLAKRWFWDEPRAAPPRPDFPGRPSACVPIAVIAGYDGLFGPGTGTFFLSYLERLGFETVSANAATKVLNLSSNAGALLVFAFRARVLWPIGIACAFANMAGNLLGSSLVIRRGQSLVRITVLVVTAAMLIRSLFAH